MAVENLVLETARISNQAVEVLQGNLHEYEAQVWARLEAFLKKFDTKDGAFVANDQTPQLIAAIKREMRGVVELDKLTTSTNAFVANFDAIQDNVRAIHGEQSGIVVPKSLVNRPKAWAVEQTEYALKDANIHPAFIEPVRKALFTHINAGASVADTERILKALVIGPDGKNGVLTRWAGQVATDAINQYEGIVQAAIATDNGLTAIRYVNSLVENSRAQCIRWVGMEWLPEAIIAEEVAWAKKNGTGMVPETTAGTFLIYRGGYRCRHKGIPVRDELARRMIAEKGKPKKKSPEEILAADKAQARVELEALLAEANAKKAEAIALADLAESSTPEEIATLIERGKTIQAKGEEIVARSEKWSRFHTSGATPDPELSELLGGVQVVGLFDIPEELKGISQAIATAKSKQLKALHANLSTLLDEVNAELVKAKNAKTKKALVEAKKAAKEKAKGFKENLQTMKGLANEANTQDALGLYNEALGFEDMASGIVSEAFKILDPPKKAKPKPKIEGELNTSNWTPVGGQKGSNPGGLFKDEKGDLWYVKEPPSSDHVRNEVLAAKLYRALGIEVPEVRIANNGKKVVVASRIVEGAADPVKLASGTVASIRDGFAADAWLANWDVVGTKFDNVVFGPKGAVRIDLGGSLRYRAQGTAKGDSFGVDVKEFDSLRSASTNPNSAKAFAKLNPAEVFERAKQIQNFSQSPYLEALVREFGPESKFVADQLLSTLRIRAGNLYFKAKKWAENPTQPVKPATFEGKLAPFSLRIKAKGIEEILDKLKAVEHPMLDLYQPKGVFAGALSKGQAKKIVEHVRKSYETNRRKTGYDIEPTFKTTAEHRGKMEALRSKFPEGYDALKLYTGTAYERINRALYTKDEAKRQLLKADKALADRIAQAIEGFQIQEALVVHRGVSGDYAQHLFEMGPKLEGLFLKMPAFSSTTIAPGGAFTGQTQMNILLPKQSKAAYLESMTGATGEFELLIQRGAYLAVLETEQVDGKLVITCVLVANE